MVLDGHISSDVHAISGVPQGSVLRPLLFLIYVNSVTDISFTNGTKISLYADDILLCKPIRTDHDFTNLQEDLDALYISVVTD